MAGLLVSVLFIAFVVGWTWFWFGDEITDFVKKKPQSEPDDAALADMIVALFELGEGWTFPTCTAKHPVLDFEIWVGNGCDNVGKWFGIGKAGKFSGQSKRKIWAAYRGFKDNAERVATLEQTSATLARMEAWLDAREKAA